MGKKNRKSHMNVYSNLAHSHKTRKDNAARKRAIYLASLPKHPVKRIIYRMHPKRVAGYWFSKRGAFMALKVVAIILLLGVLTVGGLFAYYRKDLDQIRPGTLAQRVQTTVTKYYDRNGELLWEDKGEGNYTLAVDGKDINDYMKKATVAVEDRDFYKHSGISITGMVRSGVNNITGGDTQGGSTLTQQLVKQVFFVEESHDRGLSGIPRKIKEMILSIEVERMYNKDQILNLYLNESPYGGRRNGVESAAQTYFGKKSKDLTIAESALLAGIPNSPGLYDPYNTAGNKALIARQHKVLDSMVEVGYITTAQAKEAKAVPILDQIKPLSGQMNNIQAPHFVQYVRSELSKELGQATVGRGGLSVKTTIDMRIQRKLEESMNDMFASGKDEYAGFTNGASVVEDNQTGQIIAMLGSRDFNYPGYGQDNATTAFIQPGSTIKPLVFAQLFKDQGENNQNFGSGSILADDRSMDKIYGAPLRNADGKYMGNITIRRALALSRNVPAVKAMHTAGIKPTRDLIHEMGDTPYCTQGPDAQAGLSSAIGGCGTRMIDHVNAFATLGRQGIYKPTSSILEVKNSQNTVIKKYKDESKPVLDPQIPYILSDILSDDNARAGLYGRNLYGLVTPGVRTAVKTGTSDKGGQPKDIWTMSYSPALTMGVWLGNPDTTTLTNGNSSIPAKIIGDVMAYAHTDVYASEGKWKPGDWFTEPQGIQKIGGELYPSWYNRAKNQSNSEMTFDTISKKKATTCTPPAAQTKLPVSTYKDPVTKKDIITGPSGYNAYEDDDVHKCEDVKPTVRIESAEDKVIKVSVANGTFKLKNLVLQIGDKTIADTPVASAGTLELNSADPIQKGMSVTATLNDEAMYTASSTFTR